MGAPLQPSTICLIFVPLTHYANFHIPYNMALLYSNTKISVFNFWQMVWKSATVRLLNKFLVVLLSGKNTILLDYTVYTIYTIQSKNKWLGRSGDWRDSWHSLFPILPGCMTFLHKKMSRITPVDKSRKWNNETLHIKFLGRLPNASTI